jgi:hypothetical protein
VTARDVWLLPAAAVVAGTVVAGGLILLAADSLLRGVARVTGVKV